MLAKVPKRTKLICYDATSLKPVYLPVPAVLPHKKHIVTGLRAVKAGPVAVRCWSPLSLESKTRDLSIMCYVQMTIKRLLASQLVQLQSLLVGNRDSHKMETATVS